MRGLKIVVIGGGSSYTPELADGLIRRYSSFPVRELVLVDIEAGKRKVGIIADLIERMFSSAGLNTKVTYTLDRRGALPGADFIVSQFRVGCMAARARDESIPLKYGIVGQETTGPGGFANALRTIQVILEICRDIEELCPNAWLINFTNPSGIITEAVLRHSKVKCLGLCNIPINMISSAAKIFGVERSAIDCRISGLNHLSFMSSLSVNGTDRLDEFLEAVSGGMNTQNMPAEISGDFLKILGMLPTSYIRYYYLQKQTLEEENEKLRKTGKTRAIEVMEIEDRLFEMYSDKTLDKKPEELSKRGGALYSEAAVALMDSIFNDRRDMQVVNTVNRDSIPGLPEDSVVEVNCIIGRDGAEPIKGGHLPLTVEGLVQQAKAYERLTIEAAVTGDRNKALLALLNNPLVHDVMTAWSLLDEILSANKDYLGIFFKEGSIDGVSGGN